MPFADAVEIAALIDHTLLKPDAVEADILTLCGQAVEHGFASVCVNPHWVPLVKIQLSGSLVQVCSVVGFPLGANRTEVKICEAKLAADEGASEIDMVMNVGAFRSGVNPRPEIERLAAVVHESGAILKVILETCLLTTGQIAAACQAAKDAGADFVKTSTGFSTVGATEEHVALMRRTVGALMGVKASGGIRTLDAFTRMVHAGANRIGSSSGVQIIAEYLKGDPAAPGSGGSY